MKQQVCGRAALQPVLWSSYDLLLQNFACATGEDTQEWKPCRAVKVCVAHSSAYWLSSSARVCLGCTCPSSSSSSSCCCCRGEWRGRAGLEHPLPGEPHRCLVGAQGCSMADRPVLLPTPPRIPAVPRMPRCSFAFSNINKQSHPEFERKGCIFVPLKDN